MLERTIQSLVSRLTMHSCVWEIKCLANVRGFRTLN